MRSVGPNIILFVVDDMGWQDTSVPFAPEPTPWNRLYRTPHMEALARLGVKFTNAYSAHPVCSPSRSSLMTGKNPARTGIDDWVGHGHSSNSFLRSPAWQDKGLQPDGGHSLLPDLLRKAGYRTIHVGKAHFGGADTAGADPARLGFVINIAGSHSGGPWGGWISPWIGKYRALYPKLEDRPKGEHLTEALTAKAMEAMDAAITEGVPFFLHMAHFAVHTRIAEVPRFIGNYQDGRPKIEADYASMIEAMDASLGSLLKKLRDPNGDGDASDSVAHETLVIFTSDNGGLSNHTRSTAGKVTIRPEFGGAIEATFARDWHNHPLRSGKGSAYEGGIRVPLIAAWADPQRGTEENPQSQRLKTGSTITEPVHMDDLFPTILDAAGLAQSLPLENRDGQSLVPLLEGEPFERQRPLFWHYPHQWYRDVGVGLGIEPFSAMRKGDYKVIYFYGDGLADGEGEDPRVELYDLGRDLSESRDLSRIEPELCIALRDELCAYLRSVDPGIPIVKATGRAADLPKPMEPLGR